MTRAEALGRARRRLAGAGVDGAALDARLLLLAALGLDAIDLVRAPESPASGAGLRALDALLERRVGGEPVARILGEKEFYGLTFRLTPATLVPRPDTEILVDEALRILPKTSPARVLDLGTGAGCILLAVLHELPLATGIGVDLSFEAARAARDNAVRLGLAGRAGFVSGDWAAALATRFDIVLANPPYVPSRDISSLAPEVARFDPRLALDGGRDGLDAYRAALADLPRLLRPGGSALVEIGHDQANSLRGLARDLGLPQPQVLVDLGGKDRVLVIRP